MAGIVAVCMVPSRPLRAMPAAMVSNTGSSQTSGRYFDDASPLTLLTEDSDAGPRTVLVVRCSICENPDCPCRSMTLNVCRLQADGDAVVCPPGSGVNLMEFDVDTGELTELECGEGLEARETNHQLAEELRSRLSDAHKTLLRKRFLRTKRARPDQWRHQDWSTIDLDYLVPYLQVFPDDWDLSTVLDRQRFWLVDYWCLKPNCDCSELQIGVIAEQSGSVGMVRVSVDRWKVLEVRGEPLTRRVWSEFIREDDAKKQVQARGRAMRRVAKELPVFLAATRRERPASPARVVGRNEPCPCGSGKKYKRCCGG